MERLPSPLRPRYKLYPTDKELVVHYLKKKILNQQLSADIIRTVNLGTYMHLVQLPLGEFFQAIENEWYFYSTKPEHVNDSWKETSRYEIFEGNEVVGFMKIFALSNSEPPLLEPERRKKKGKD